MFSKRLVMMSVIAFAPAFAQDTIAPRQHSPIIGRVDHFDGTSTSTNWSGYAITGSTFTSATASWVVPTASCTGDTSDEYAAFWVGLDGYSSSTVEQTGTDSDCNSATPSYYAWYEFYPNPSIRISSITVSPGDKMFASVTFANSQFTVVITDETTGATFTKTASVSGATASSAEWIAEAPCCANRLGGILPLSDFGTIAFGPDFTGISATNNATTATQSGPIGSFPAANVTEINKIASRTSPQISNCTALSGDGTSFSCTWGPGSGGR